MYVIFNKDATSILSKNKDNIEMSVKEEGKPTPNTASSCVNPNFYIDIVDNIGIGKGLQ